MPQISTTPANITPAIISLCHELVADTEPEFLAVAPVSNADVNDCFPVVERYVRDHGGSICYGWQIWEWSGVMVEAEFHAVWRSPTGELRDITPKQVSISQILFLPDPSRQYEGRQVPNLRKSLSPDQRVAEFIARCEEEFEFMNRGERATQYGELELSPQEVRELAAIQQRKNELYRQLDSRAPHPGRNDPCFCGSGTKYKKCCGR